MEDTGLEPVASCMPCKEGTVPSGPPSGLTSTESAGCTTGCTSSTENALGSDSKPGDGSTGSDGFAAALMMIAGLPLSDADKAEAVKRLLRDAGR